MPELAHQAEKARLRGDIPEAIAAAREAVRLMPNNAACLRELVAALMWADDYRDVNQLLSRALALDPEDGFTRGDLAKALLMQGEYRPGFRELVAMFRRANGSEYFRPDTPLPEWGGWRMPGRRLVVVCSQGAGDVIQFARYFPMVAERVGEAVVLCQPSLAVLLREVGAWTFHTIPYQLSESGSTFRFKIDGVFDAWVFATHLPEVFGTELHTIPATVPYLRADEFARRRWCDRLAPTRSGQEKLVGLVWAGNPENERDTFRSVPLKVLAPILRTPGVRFVSVQKPIPVSDQADFAAAGLADYSAELTDFAETAALLGALDLLIAVDTGTAHMAGALGLPVWVLVSQPADWRWLRGRTDSPWYPTARLFRQPAPLDWDAAVAELAAALAQFLAPPPPGPAFSRAVVGLLRTPPHALIQRAAGGLAKIRRPGDRRQPPGNG